jgi:hypothetical protein
MGFMSEMASKAILNDDLISFFNKILVLNIARCEKKDDENLIRKNSEIQLDKHLGEP